MQKMAAKTALCKAEMQQDLANVQSGMTECQRRMKANPGDETEKAKLRQLAKTWKTVKASMQEVSASSVQAQCVVFTVTAMGTKKVVSTSSCPCSAESPSIMMQ